MWIVSIYYSFLTFFQYCAIRVFNLIIRIMCRGVVGTLKVRWFSLEILLLIYWLLGSSCRCWFSAFLWHYIISNSSVQGEDGLEILHFSYDYPNYICWHRLSFRRHLVHCDVSLMWCTLWWYDIKFFSLFYFF